MNMKLAKQTLFDVCSNNPIKKCEWTSASNLINYSTNITQQTKQVVVAPLPLLSCNQTLNASGINVTMCGSSDDLNVTIYGSPDFSCRNDAISTFIVELKLVITDSCERVYLVTVPAQVQNSM